MLEEMRIRGLGVIDDAVLELSPGLTVVTGETGAGKTMVVTGLGLLFGGRADAGAVRPGVDAASVEGRLRVDPAGPVAARAEDAGAELDDDALLLARTVTAAGRSRAHLGGRSVPAGTLAELAEATVAVHGQADQTRLRAPARQREALDRFAGSDVADPLAGYQQAFDELRTVESELDALTTRDRDREHEADLLRFGLAEVAAADPKPGEPAELLAEEARLGHADTLRTAAATAHRALLGDDSGVEGSDAAALLADARAVLEQASGHDGALDELAGRVRELGYLVGEAGADLTSYAGSIESDPARLAAVADRRGELSRLARKYLDPDRANAADTDMATGLLDWAARGGVRLAELEGADDRIESLRHRGEELRRVLTDTGGRVSRARTKAAARFADLVGIELAALAMAGAAVQMVVTQTADETTGLDDDGRPPRFGRHGLDDVELLLCPHAGASARPLQKGASGGELSRVMLAIEVVLAGTAPVPTLVFDEVDAGVGGKAAVEVGRRLAALARDAQVLVVTHLPQVAAFADTHLVVRKSQDGAVTRSGVVAVDGQERLRELSRMLAGQEDSATAEAHARELLTAARTELHTPS